MQITLCLPNLIPGGNLGTPPASVPGTTDQPGTAKQPVAPPKRLPSASDTSQAPGWSCFSVSPPVPVASSPVVTSPVAPSPGPPGTALQLPSFAAPQVPPLATTAPPSGTVSAAPSQISGHFATAAWLSSGVMVLIVIFAAVGLVIRLRRSPYWSLRDMLSDAEEGGKPSTSRVVAFFGLAVISAVVFGVGMASMWRIFAGASPDLNGFAPFLLGTATLFAPYAVNQLKASMQSTSPSPPTPPVPGGLPQSPLGAPPNPAAPAPPSAPGFPVAPVPPST